METTMTATRIDRGSTATTTIYSEGGDLVFERTFDAPRELVWKAFTDPELVPRWWGKHGTTTKVVEMDVRPGGTWRYVSSAPDRDDVVFYGEYLEVDAARGLQMDVHVRRRGRRPAWAARRRTPSRTSTAGRRITSIGHIGSAEAIEGALATGMAEGAIETWDRLEALLAEG